MTKKINFYRVVSNMLFYIFYVLLVSIIFSFIFPTILVILWKDVLDPSDPLFANIQIAIFILIFIFTLTFRKFFYLPVFSSVEKVVLKDNKKENIEVKVVENIQVENKELKTENTVDAFTKFEDIKVDNIDYNIEKAESYKPDIIYNNDNFIVKNESVDIEDNFPNLDIKIGKEIK